jgi:SAM-dependent methyltransferase
MDYSTRLLERGSFLTRLSHRARYARTLDLVGDVRAALVLDYGCGDAWLLRHAHDRGIARAGWGVDLSPDMRKAAYAAFEGVSGFEFVAPDAMAGTVTREGSDLVFCTETLEHVRDPEGTIDLLCTYLKPGGRMLITVPIEVGPSLLGKQAGRYLAALRGDYGYERYAVRELFDAAVRWEPRTFPSSHLDADTPERGHKGFDFRRIEPMLSARTTIERRVFTPFPALGKFANSTVMWLCRKDA